MTKLPLFFEVHRLSLFSPRSLDVDVVLDLMIHDIDVVLSLTGSDAGRNTCCGYLDPVRESGYRERSSGLSGRLRSEPYREPGIDRTCPQAATVPAVAVHFARLCATGRARFSVHPERQIGFEPVAVEKSEPLKLELESFFQCVAARERPEVTGADATRALEVAGDS